MDTRTVFSRKAENYARYRWDYAPQAIEAIFTAAQLNAESCVADIGAGTGILTSHFVGRVNQVYAVEPDAEMRRMAEIRLVGCNDCQILDGEAEATTLPDHSIDLVTAAQAIHWFNPEPARAEFRRILKPGGWLAVLNNNMTDTALGLALADLASPKYGFDARPAASKPEWKPLIYYYGNGRFQRIHFQFMVIDDWERFMGSLISMSGMPDEDHPLYSKLERSARGVFERFSQNGRLELHGITELFIGQVSGIKI